MTIAEDVVMFTRHGIGRAVQDVFTRKPRHVREVSDGGGCGPLLGMLLLMLALYLISQFFQFINQGPTP